MRFVLVFTQMLKTKNQLKKEAKEVKEIYSWTIKLKCFDCMGCFADKEFCNHTDCPLFPFTFKRGDLKTKIFKRLIGIFKKVSLSEQYPKPSFWLEVINREVLGSEKEA